MQTNSELNSVQCAIVIAALRHLQQAIEKGDDLSCLSDICEMTSIQSETIDELCEKINFSELSATPNSYTDDGAYRNAKAQAQQAANDSRKKMVLGYSNYAGWCHVDAVDVNGVAELGDASVIEPEKHNSEAS